MIVTLANQSVEIQIENKIAAVDTLTLVLSQEHEAVFCRKMVRLENR